MPSFLAVDEVLGMFGADSATAIRRYRAFVEGGMARAAENRGQSNLMEP